MTPEELDATRISDDAPNTLGEIEAFEADHGLEIPTPYRDFLLTRGAGHFRSPVITCGDWGDGLSSLWGVRGERPENEHDTDLESGMLIFEDNDPPLFLPFGYTAMGALLILLVGEDDPERGAVWRKLPSQQDYLAIAASFDDFVASLTAEGSP